MKFFVYIILIFSIFIACDQDVKPYTEGQFMFHESKDIKSSYSWLETYQDEVLPFGTKLVAFNEDFVAVNKRSYEYDELRFLFSQKADLCYVIDDINKKYAVTIRSICNSEIEYQNYIESHEAIDSNRMVDRFNATVYNLNIPDRDLATTIYTTKDLSINPEIKLTLAPYGLDAFVFRLDSRRDDFELIVRTTDFKPKIEDPSIFSLDEENYTKVDRLW